MACRRGLPPLALGLSRGRLHQRGVIGPALDHPGVPLVQRPFVHAAHQRHAVLPGDPSDGSGERARDRLGDLDQTILPLLSKASTHIITGIGAVMGAVLIPILSFFFLKDGAAIRDAIVEAAAGARRELIDDIFSDLHLLLAQYIRALVILSIATFIFYMTFLSSMRVPYPILLSGLAALLEYIPVVGPLTASAVILLVAGFAGYQHLVWILVFLVVYRIFQDYVLSPYLLSSGVKIHPLLVLFGVLAGEQLAGIPGMFFSVPVIAALRLILIRLGRRRMRPASL